jgi:hypothetical protein
MLVPNSANPSNQSPLTSSFILAPPINVEEMVEYWTSKGCDCNIMFQRIRDYHTTNPVCEISNGKELAKIPGSQTIFIFIAFVNLSSRLHRLFLIFPLADNISKAIIP